MRKSFSANYFQGILQLRPANERLMYFIEKQFLPSSPYWIAQKVILKIGIDYYISSNKFVRILGRKLKQNFKGELRESIKLHGKDRQTSKKLYRVTVCFRMRKGL